MGVEKEQLHDVPSAPTAFFDAIMTVASGVKYWTHAASAPGVSDVA
jgi:hypothetical protein